MKTENKISTRKGKRGIRNVSEYKRDVIKKSRVKGSAYKRWSGALAPAVNQGPDCK